ncbi:MAG: RNA polymerase subunit sigma, partial [Cyanobacteria bacterium J06600_6]
MGKILACKQASAVDAETETGQTTERELIFLCQQGDRDCFRLLYQRYQHRVRSTLYQLCGSA